MSLLNSLPGAVIEDKEKLEENFLSFLHELDYPEGSLFRGPSFQLGQYRNWRAKFHDLMSNPRYTAAQPLPCYADLAILDLETCQYAALIEFRLQLDGQVEARLAALFKAILDRLQTRPPVFLVVPGVDSGFRILQLRDNGVWQEIPKGEFPHHATLIAGLAAEKAIATEVRQTRDLDHFNVICHLLAIAVGAIAIANITGLGALNSRQISLLTLAAALAIAPYAIAFRNSTPKNKPRILKLK